MHKLFRIFTVVLFVLLFLGISSIAEEITLTTYYPAPYGKYEELEVSKNDASTGLAVVNTGSSTAPRYPGLSAQNYLGTAGGHPYVNMSNHGGTEDTPLPSPSGTHLGTLIYSGYNGTTSVQAARIGVRTTANFSATSSPVDYPADMYFNVGTNGTCCGITRMTIKGDTGNVGVGTTTPNWNMQIHKSGTGASDHSYLQFTTGDTGTAATDGLLVGYSASNKAYIWNYENTALGLATNNAERLTILAGGNVGIGTTGPVTKLHVVNSGSTHSTGVYSGPGDFLLRNTNITGVNQGAMMVFGSSWNPPGQGYHAAIKGANDVWANNGAGNLQFYTAAQGSGNQLYERMRIDSYGNVGIGCDPSVGSPAKLKVNGKIRASDTTGADKGIFAFDLGEDILAKGCEAGDVVVIDPDNSVQVIKSTQPFDKTVAGIISESPIFHIGDEDEEGYLPLALAGRVRCKVLLENGPIERGDLLTTSSTPGHAMKATDRERSFGAILGKALEPFSGGPEGEKTGKIVVLVTLQ